MSELLKQGLLMTVIGMGLVFVTLILFWGLLAAMGHTPTWKKKRGKTESAHINVQEEPDSESATDMRGLYARAAAAAVAVAIAGQQNHTHPTALPTQALTPWQASRRFAQINSTGRIYQRNTRGNIR